MNDKVVMYAGTIVAALIGLIMIGLIWRLGRRKLTIIPLLNDYLSHNHPHTAVALDRASNTLMLFLVDGRQPNYSEGVNIPELAAIILSHGGYNALNLDGGGSVALAIEG